MFYKVPSAPMDISYSYKKLFNIFDPAFWKYISTEKVGSENVSPTYMRWGDLINFHIFDNCIQYSLYSCFSLQAPFTLIVGSLYCIPQYFLTNGASTLFAAWRFMLCKRQDSMQHLSVFWDKVYAYCIRQSFIPIFISTSFTVWNNLLCNLQNFVLHLSVFSHKWQTCI